MRPSRSTARRWFTGVDYTTLKFEGTSAVDYARHQGDAKLQQLLDPRSGKL
jgi:hypothetical protein